MSGNETLIHADGRILAAIDLSPYADSVAALAGWAAARVGAGLDLVHAIERPLEDPRHDLSGAIALGAREALLSELVELDEQRSREAQARSRDVLARLRDEVEATHGVQAQVLLRHGNLVDTLLDLEAQARLFVVGKRGEEAAPAREQLGAQLETIARAVHRPLLVAALEPRPVRRFLIAFDGSPTTRRCVELVAASPLLQRTECHLLMAGDDDAAHRDALEWATARLGDAGFAPHASLVDGAPAAAISAAVARDNIDLLVMGAYGHGRIRRMFVGSTTTSLLRSCRIPVLLLR